MSKNNYDLVILGADLPSLLLARHAARNGLKTLVATKQDTVGGTLAPVSIAQTSLYRDFGYWPSSDQFVSTLEWIESLCQKSLTTGLSPRPAVTFQKGQFVSFVGFGDKAPPCVDALRTYLDYENMDLKAPLSSLVNELISLKEFDIRKNFVVEKFEYQDGSIVSATTIDGATILASRWVISDPLKNFFQLLPTEHYSAREQARLHRTKVWTQVSLHILHSVTVSNERGVHVVMGTTDEAVPSIGGFEAPQPDGAQASHWFCFIDPETQDDETTATALREMKRQLKRAYPGAFEKNQFERISVEPEASGVWSAKTDASGRWQGLKNCWALDIDNNPDLGVFSKARQAYLTALHITKELSKDAPVGQAAEPQGELGL